MKMYKLLVTTTFVMLSMISVSAQENQSENPEKIKEKSKLPSIYDSTFTSQDNQKTARFLALEKGGRKKRIKFFVGDQIQVKLKDDQTKYKFIIQDITEDAIVVWDTELKLQEIRSITISKQITPLLKTATVYLPIAGIGYFILDVVDFAVLNPSTIIISSILTVGGLLLNLLKKRTYKIGKKKYLKSVRLME